MEVNKNKLKEAVNDLLRNLVVTEYAENIEKLLIHSNKCLNLYGGYVDK